MLTAWDVHGNCFWLQREFLPTLVVMSIIGPQLRIVHGRLWHIQKARGSSVDELPSHSPTLCNSVSCTV